MRRRLTSLLIPLASLYGRQAAAQGEVTAAASPPPAAAVVDCTNLTPEDCALANAAEQIPIYDERPDKPFDRDTEVRLTGEQLAARGATDLGSALALLPDVTVRDAGRGGTNIDIRGGRKGEITILVDGVLVTDPYYGTFDLSSIPITDIVQIRVSPTPQSPIDGPGGPGGVIEVHTRDAIGPQQVIVRLLGDSLPETGITSTARVALDKHLALRLSGGATYGARDFTLQGGAMSVPNDSHDTNGSTRLEYRDGDARIAIDGFLDDRHYLIPPNEQNLAFQMVDRETSARVSAKANDKVWGDYQVQLEAWSHYLHRISRGFSDPTMQTQTTFEDLHGWRNGGQALITHALGKEWRWAASTTVDYESADVGTLGKPAQGDDTLLEAAGDVQYEHKTVRVDASVGVAAPIGVGADPWPEAKLVVKYRPSYGHLELATTLGRKGRVPSLRERFDFVDGGNPALAPEMADHVEIRAIEQATDKLRLELAPFYRYTNGIIRFDTDMNSPTFNKLTNLGVVQFFGLDLLARWKIVAPLEVGGGWSTIRARGDSPNPVVHDHPLDRLPENRFDAWVQYTPMPNLSGIVRATYFGDNIGNNMGMEVVLPGYTQFQASATWQASKKYLLVLRGDDLTDVRPETRPKVHGPGRTISLILQGSWD